MTEQRAEVYRLRYHRYGAASPVRSNASGSRWAFREATSATSTPQTTKMKRTKTKGRKRKTIRLCLIGGRAAKIPSRGLRTLWSRNNGLAARQT